MSDQQSESLQRLTLTMILLNAFTTPLMLSAVNVALPSIAKDLSMNAVLLSWIPMAYLMASAMFVLIFGRIADMVGRKRIFLTGTAFVYKNESAYAVITELPDIVETAPGMAVTARINKENDMTPMQAVGG